MESVCEKEEKLTTDEEVDLINISDEEMVGFAIDERTENFLLRSDEQIRADEMREMDIWKQEKRLMSIEAVPEGSVFPPADTPIEKVIEMVNNMIKERARKRLEYVEKNGKWNLFLDANGKPYVPENLIRTSAHFPPAIRQFEVWKPTCQLPNTSFGQKSATNSSDSTGDQNGVKSSIDSSGEIDRINMESCKAVELYIAKKDNAEPQHDISENFLTSLMTHSHSESETLCKRVKEIQRVIQEEHENRESNDEVQVVMETDALSTKGLQADEENVNEGPVKRDYEKDMQDAGTPVTNFNPKKSTKTTQSSGNALGEQDPKTSGEALKRSRQESPFDRYPRKRFMIVMPVKNTHKGTKSSVAQAPPQKQEPLMLRPINKDTDDSLTVENRHLAECPATSGERTESPEKSVAPAM